MANVKFTTGNFDLNIDGDLKAEKQAEALTAGIRYIVQRDGATKAYKALFGDENGGEQKRKDIEYNDENAEAIRKAFEDAMAEYGAFTVTVAEHEAAEKVSSRSQATAMWAQRTENPAMIAALGLKPDASDEEGIEACHEFLKTLRKPAGKAKG